ENIFNRMDTIVRYLAIEEYYGENNCGFRLYDKMQRARGQKIHDIDRFKELIKSIERNGFSKDSSILVDPNLQLVDGSHRLACALYFNLKRISINTQLQPVNIEYSIDWFKDAGFTEEELE
ncbi:ParB N-terminal domain-containing protein, partial [Stenotrophomonas maltophilia group sp. RNC7]|uniref:ParB N-terminal domain-containing protein n=1 Tax=Stenotrophomonas maltophilia group sp. RNC7 TaxID=3071467 RepID=UPI0027E01477